MLLLEIAYNYLFPVEEAPVVNIAQAESSKDKISQLTQRIHTLEQSTTLLQQALNEKISELTESTKSSIEKINRLTAPSDQPIAHPSTTPTPGFIDSQGNQYYGETSCGLPHGLGRMEYSNGNTHTGTWLARVPHGEGTLNDTITGNSYYGSWTNGQKHGIFTLLSSNGDKIQLEYQHGTVCGDVTIIKYNKEKLTLLNPKSHLQEGKMTFGDGTTYEGVYWFSDSPCRVNQRENGLPHGKGVLTSANGKNEFTCTYHCGNLKFAEDGPRNSFANLVKKISDKGVKYEGTLMRPDGVEYTGEFIEKTPGSLDLIPHGKGSIVHLNGVRFEGTWDHNQLFGDVQVTFPMGTVVKAEVSLPPEKPSYEEAADRWEWENPKEIISDKKNVTMDHATFEVSFLLNNDFDFLKYGNEKNALKYHAKINYNNGSKYFGECNLEGLQELRPHGKGKMVYPDKSSFDGQWHKGKKYKGTLTFADGTIVKSDAWSNSKAFPQQGSIILNGDSYELSCFNYAVLRYSSQPDAVKEKVKGLQWPDDSFIVPPNVA